MLKKILGKAVAGTAAAGLVLVPTAATVAPQIANVACEYPDSTATNTDLNLNFSVAPYGTRNGATVNVTSGAGTPQGKVRIAVETRGATVQTLRNGSASRNLPRALDAGRTYTVAAKFLGKCSYRNSGDRAFYTVQKASVNVNPAVINGRKALFSSAFRGSGGLDPQGGRATFLVKRAGNHKTVRGGRVGVRHGYAQVNLRNLPRGKFKLVVRYSGTSNFKSSGDAIHFRVG